MKGTLDRELEKLDFKDQSAVIQERKHRIEQERIVNARQEALYKRRCAAQHRAWAAENWDLGL